MSDMDRCAQAYQYHKAGYNCAQAVAASCADLAGRTPEEVLAGLGGFGGGIGGSHEEVCGAISGGVYILGLRHPFTEGQDAAAKRKIYAQAKEFRRRFMEIFGHSRCGDLLRARPGVSEKTPSAQRLGITTHCDIMIVTAVELLEALLAEEPA